MVSRVDYCSSILVGVSTKQLHRLQSVLNASARLIFSARKSDHVTPLLQEMHWLKVSEMIQFRLCVLVYRCLHGSAPTYLAETLHTMDKDESRSRLRSASSLKMVVPVTRRSTLGDRAFPVAAAREWNRLPRNVMSSSSLETFRKHLKSHLFNASYPM